MVGAGLFLGASFDTYSRLRKESAYRWLRTIEDIFFWMLNGFFVFIWLKSVNEGEVRFYIFLAILLGFSIYKVFVQHTFKRVLEVAIYYVVKTYEVVTKLLYVLIVKPLMLLFQMLMAIVLFIVGIVQSIMMYLYKLLKRIWDVLIVDKAFKALVSLYKRVLNYTKKKQANEDDDEKEQQLNNEGKISNSSPKKRGFLKWVTNKFFKR